MTSVPGRPTRPASTPASPTTRVAGRRPGPVRTAESGYCRSRAVTGRRWPPRAHALDTVEQCVKRGQHRRWPHAARPARCRRAGRVVGVTRKSLRPCAVQPRMTAPGRPSRRRRRPRRLSPEPPAHRASAHRRHLRPATSDFSPRGRPIPRGAGAVGSGMSVAVVTVRTCRGFGCCRPLSRRRSCWRTAGTRGMCGIWRWSSSNTGNRAVKLPAMWNRPRN